MSRPDLEIVVQHLLMYRELGFSLIPLKGKRPLVKWKDYEYDIRDFLAPGVNIGIKAGPISPTDHLYFIDLDDRALIGDFYEANPLLLGSPMVSTGHGAHIYLSWKEPVKTRVFNKMEIRGEGSYVVCPPSRHSSGKLYRFVTPLRMPPTYKPEWLGFASAKALPQPKIALNPLANNNENSVGNQPAVVQQGQRHNALLRYLGFLHGAHFSEEEALARALAWNAKCTPPLTRDEVIHAAHTAWEKWDIYDDGGAS